MTSATYTPALHGLDALIASRIGRVVDQKFRITRLLGAGGMAAVYEAVQQDGQRVALKMLQPAHGAVLERRKRLLREAYLANNLAHTDVAHVFADGVDDDGSAFLVMELLQGESVADMQRLAGGRLDPARVLWIADRVLDVLAVAHAAGVVHRDIKPDNLFVTAQGRIKVLDFGVARLHEAAPGMTLDTVPGTMLGTVAFMPPEQARGISREVDQRTDLWALGATLFNLLSGELVHPGETPNERLGMAVMRHARSLREVCPDAPEKLVKAIDRALRFERRDRFADARSMQRALREASDTIVPGAFWQGARRSAPDVPAVQRGPMVMARARAALAEISEYTVPRHRLPKRTLVAALAALGLLSLVVLAVRVLSSPSQPSAATARAQAAEPGVLRPAEPSLQVGIDGRPESSGSTASDGSPQASPASPRSPARSPLATNSAKASRARAPAPAASGAKPKRSDGILEPW